ncbi:winged helix-turn-helix transcriptional regulator [Lactiplantibacillus plajomi]|uniref:Winged helix-turn-helix transcriptional regulator n=1 Tax=Lactiplantibacillus plajomi TaxID=1457217 RepID=A0ABV6K447_9LACO|nr:helix-turn-helix domain-containing protein [Lactiplantibacillus plajomi]
MVRKHYDCAPGCPIQNTLQFIAGKWKTVILYHLFNAGVLRFSELQRKLPYVTKRMLARQLAELEADGIIQKTVYATVPVKTEYAVSAFGATFRPVIQAMADWGTDYLEADGKAIGE